MSLSISTFLHCEHGVSIIPFRKVSYKTMEANLHIITGLSVTARISFSSFDSVGIVSLRLLLDFDWSARERSDIHKLGNVPKVSTISRRGKKAVC